MVGDPPDYGGDTSFSFFVEQSGTTQRTPCLYPNRDYLVTATTYRVPDTERFRNLIADGLFDPSDPDNIRLRITDGVQSGNATYGDYPLRTDRPALQRGNGLWADYKDTVSGKPRRQSDYTTTEDGRRPVGSAGIRDFQIYPNKGYFKEVNANTDDKVLFRYDADALPALPIPPELPPKGIVDVIVVNPGYGYLPGPDGSSGGDGAVWAPADSTIITGDPGDGSTDYYPPVPPGNTVGIPTNGTVTTPINSNPADAVDPNGNMTEVLPGTPTFLPEGGTITTPPIVVGGGDGGYQANDTNNNTYPPNNPNIWIPVDRTGDSWDPNTNYRAGDIVSIGNKGTYPSTNSYPVILYLCELIVDQSGMKYNPEDEIVIEPSMGATAVPKFDNFGRLLSIKVTAGGEGFTTRPKVFIRSQTGFGAQHYS